MIDLDRLRINLLYIASNGRSGSSVLDRYCGELKGIVTLGELQNLYHELFSGRRCGCGLSMNNCSHWNVIAKKKKDLQITSSFRELPGHGKVLRFRKLFNLFRSNSKMWDIEYSHATLRLIKEAYSENLSLNPLFVDNSKDLYRLNSLMSSNLLSLTVVHLVKDPRGFVCSMTRGKTGLKRKILIIRYAFRYLIENWLITVVTQKLESRKVLPLRYEDFTSDTGSLQDFIKYNYASLSKALDSDTILPQHPIAGNIARFGDKLLKTDKRWFTELTDFEKKIIWLICGLFAKKFGYKNG